MRHIEVLGFECTTCRKTYQLIEETASALEITIRLEKVHDPSRIAAYRILAVPAVAVDGELRYSGGTPSRQQIEAWLSTDATHDGKENATP
ncbi:MAG: thioredoxin family protein [Thioalkalivibrio sp.]